MRRWLLICLTNSGNSTMRTVIVRKTIDRPHAQPLLDGQEGRQPLVDLLQDEGDRGGKGVEDAHEGAPARLRGSDVRGAGLTVGAGCAWTAIARFIVADAERAAGTGSCPPGFHGWQRPSRRSGEPAAAQQPSGGHGIDGVLAAGGREPAARTEHRADPALVERDQRDEQAHSGAHRRASLARAASRSLPRAALVATPAAGAARTTRRVPAGRAVSRRAAGGAAGGTPGGGRPSRRRPCSRPGRRGRDPRDRPAGAR